MPSPSHPIDSDSGAVREVDVLRDGHATPEIDHVAVERPVEVRLNGEPFAVIMRTPGADRALVLGFLLTEGILQRRSQVTRIDLDDDAGIANVVFSRDSGDGVAAALAGRRQVSLNSSCGLCGRRSLESLTLDAPPCQIEWAVDAALVARFPEKLLAAQSAFAQTGGLHAAGLFDLDGRLEASAEDVGRHNAVDKLLGRMLDEGRLPLTQSLLLVSGRSSFEIVQKAWIGRVPFVAAVSAPSSLAVDLARKAGVTLLGFLREGRFNVYAHASRLRATR
jgi:FdhD protein